MPVRERRRLVRTCQITSSYEANNDIVPLQGCTDMGVFKDIGLAKYEL